MRLTIAINLAEQTATLVEKHALSAGDIYDPLVLDFSSLDQAALAAVDASTLGLVLYRSSVDMTAVANAKTFSSPAGQARLRTSVLLMNQQAVLDWQASAGTGAQEAYLVVADANTTYASCPVPVVLRPFEVGAGGSAGYYTSSQVDDLLEKYQPLLSAAGPVGVDGGVVSVAAATASSAGVVKPGKGLSVAGDGTLDVQFPDLVVDSALDAGSANPVANAAVASAVSGVTGRLDALLSVDGAGGETGRLPALEASVAAKADASSLAVVATSGSYNDLADKPAIPESVVAARWITGTGVTGESSDPLAFPSSGIGSASAGDMYLNTETAGIYTCVTPGDASVATWSFVCSIRGARGPGTSEWLTGTAVTGEDPLGQLFSGASADVGDLYLNAETGGVYRCLAEPDSDGRTKWAYVCSILGPEGTAGRDGPTFRSGGAITATSGSATASVDGAATGDLYLTSAGDLFKCGSLNSNGTSNWDFVLRLAGAAGAAGADGTTWFRGTEVAESGDHAISGGTPKAGDFYLNVDTLVCYACTSADGPSWTESFSLKGEDGNAILSGTEVTETGVFALKLDTPRAGDLYVNTATKDVFRCISVDESVRTSDWQFVVSLVGVSAPASVEVGHVPTWLSTSELDRGYPVLGALPASAAAGAGSLITAGAVWTALDDLRGGLVAMPGSHDAGYVPAWESDSSLSAGYQVRTAVRQSGSATDTCLVTEAAVRAAIGAGTSVQESGTHTEGYVPQWGSGATLSAGLSLVTSVRSGTAALNTALATEAAVRAACNAVEEKLDLKKLDALAAPTKGGVNLDATATTHGLMSSKDKAKLDGIVDVSSLKDIDDALTDEDEVQVKDVSTTTASQYRKFQVARVWSYVQSKLPSYPVDKLAVSDGTTSAGDATSERHGLCPKLSGESTQFLRGDGAWAQPPGSVVFAGATDEDAGSPGQVPEAPAGSNSEDRFLKADGTWAVPPLQSTTEHLTIDGQKTVDALANDDELLLYDKSESDFRKVAASVLARFAQSFPHYDTVFVPAGAMTPRGTDGPASETLSFAGNTTVHDILRFYDTKDSYAEFDLVLPDDWDGGALRFKVLWTPSSSEGVAGQWVRFRFSCGAFGQGEDLGAALGADVTADQQMAAANVLHVAGPTAALTPGGVPLPGKALHLRIMRSYAFDGDGGSALTTGASVFGVVVQYRRTGFSEVWG